MLILVLFGALVGFMSDVTIKRTECMKENKCIVVPQEIGYKMEVESEVNK